MPRHCRARPDPRALWWLLGLGAVCGQAGAAADPSPSTAASAASDVPWTLAALSDQALRRHPDTRAAWALAAADLANVDAARALRRPSVTLDVPLSLAVSSSAAASAASGTAEPAGASRSVRSISPSLGLAWVLFDAGARASAVDAARWQAAASELSANRAVQTVVSNVEQTYYALLGARQLRSAATASVAAAQASLDAARARRQAGLATVGETAQAEAALASARLVEVRAETQARSAAGSLANAAGLAVNAPMTLAGETSALTPEAMPAPGPLTQQVDALLAEARVSRADLAASAAQLQQSRAQLAATEAQGRPTVSLNAAAGRRWGSDTTDPWRGQLAVTVSIPIFDGGLVRAQTQAARARVDAYEALRDAQRQTVDLEVWQAFQEADSAEAATGSAQAGLRSALIAEDAARERYRAGVGSLLELLVAQSSAAQARVDWIQSLYDGRLAIARLGYAVGSVVSAAASTPH